MIILQHGSTRSLVFLTPCVCYMQHDGACASHYMYIRTCIARMDLLFNCVLCSGLRCSHAWAFWVVLLIRYSNCEGAMGVVSQHKISKCD